MFNRLGGQELAVINFEGCTVKITTLKFKTATLDSSFCTSLVYNAVIKLDSQFKNYSCSRVQENTTVITFTLSCCTISCTVNTAEETIHLIFISESEKLDVSVVKRTLQDAGFRFEEENIFGAR